MNPLVTVLTSAAGVTVVAFLVVAYWKVHSEAGRTFLVWGGLTGIAIAILMYGANWSFIMLSGRFGARIPAGLVNYVWLGFGVALQLCVCLIMLGFAGRASVRTANWSEATAFGLSAGAVSVAVPAVVSAVSTSVLLRSAGEHAPEFAQAAARGYLGTVPGLFITGFTAMLVVYSVRVGSWKWFGAAVVYASLAIVGGMAAPAAFGWLGRIAHGASETVEGGISVLGQYGADIIRLALAAGGVWGLNAFRGRWELPTKNGELPNVSS